MKKLSHKQHILDLLKESGNKGVHSLDLCNWVTPRAAARINDLKNDGYEITSTHERKGTAWGARYKLVKKE